MTADDIRRIVSSYVESPMLIDELCHALATPAPAEAHGSEREEFERWAEQRDLPLDETLGASPADANGPNYVYVETVEAWEAWQARAGLATNTQPKHTAPLPDELGQWLTAIGELYIAMGRPPFEATEPTLGVVETLREAAKRLAAQAPAPAPATGDTNGRRDGLRSAVHGRVAVGGYTPGALADLLWASPDVMSLNAELGLSMDQLAQLTQAVLTAIPCAAVTHGWQPIETAPTDGRTLLLGYFNSHKKWRTLRGQWFSQAEIDDTWEEPDTGEPGWYETVVESDDIPNVWRCYPTHWMPLPTAPAFDVPVHHTGGAK